MWNRTELALRAKNCKTDVLGPILAPHAVFWGKAEITPFSAFLRSPKRTIKFVVFRSQSETIAAISVQGAFLSRNQDPIFERQKAKVM